MKKKLVVLVLAVFLLAVGLSADVANKDKPLKGEWDLKAEKVWDVSQYGKEPVAMPDIVAIHPDGTLTVFDFKYWRNYIFSKDGAYVAAFGKRGEGPGEIKSRRGMFAVTDGLIAVDHLNLRYFSKDGKYLKSVPITRDLGFPKFMISDNEYISYGQDGKFAINVVDLTNMTRRTIIEKSADGSEGVGFSTSKGMITIVIPPLTPMTYCGYDAKNRLYYYGRSDKYKINAMDESGKIVNRFSLEREKQPLTKKMKKTLNKEMGMSKQMWKRFPKELTYFSNIRVMGDHIYVFVRVFDEYYDEQPIDVFSAKGEYLYRIRFKPGDGEQICWKVHLTEDYLYAAIQDDDGEPRIVKYKIHLPH